MRKKSQRAADVFHAPGLSIERRGRNIHWEMHRSQDEFRAMQERMVASKPDIAKAIKLAADELTAILNKYSSFDLVAQLWLANGLFDAEAYMETEARQRPYCIEYAALVELKSADYRLKLPITVESSDVIRAQELIESIYTNSSWLEMARRIDIADSAPPSPLETATFFGTRRKLMVGPPAYWKHWTDVLDALFAAPEIERIVGLSLKDVRDISTAISDSMATLVAERLEAALREEEQIKRHLDEYMATGHCSGTEDAKAVMDRLRNLRQKERKRVLRHLLIQWAFVALVDQLSFTAASLSERTGIAESKIARFLDVFETRLGETASDFLFPPTSHILERRPIVNLGEKYFCPVPHRLLWAIKPRLEELLRSSSYWEPYQHSRHNFLISEAVRLLRRILANSIVETSVFYPIGPGLEAEVDALIFFDRYIFVIEGKGGSRNRSQKEAAVRARIDELSGDPARQALRAASYLREATLSVFHRQDGTSINIADVSSKEILPIAISLDSLDSYTSELSELKKIVGIHVQFWAICLTDLRVVSEIISCPSEFTHYLKWRMAVGERTDVLGDRDENNWLAIYLKDGPAIPTAAEGDDFRIFHSYTDALDSYFLHVQGDRKKVETRPSQEIPSGVRRLISALETSGLVGFTAATEFILDFPRASRREIDQALHMAGRRISDRAGCSTIRIVNKDRALVLSLGRTAAIDASSDAADMSTLVLEVDPNTNWTVLAWRIVAGPCDSGSG